MLLNLNIKFIKRNMLEGTYVRTYSIYSKQTITPSTVRGEGFFFVAEWWLPPHQNVGNVFVAHVVYPMYGINSMFVYFKTHSTAMS